MSRQALPADPSLENLKKQAKRLHKGVRDGDAELVAKVRELHPRAEQVLAKFSLADAQLVIARGYGFASWPKLREQLVVIEQFNFTPPEHGTDASADTFLRLACMDYADWYPRFAERAREMLARDPSLGRTNIYTAATAGDVATLRELLARDPALANTKGGPLRWEPLLYACYGRIDVGLDVARELLARGADPNAGFLWRGNSPPFTALTGVFGEGENGNNLPPHPQWRAFARMLLEAGADPNDHQTLYNRHFNASDEHFELLFEFGLGRETRGPWFARLGDRMFSPDKMLVEELWAAAKKNLFARVKLLVEHGTTVDARSFRDDRTPYEAAMRAGNREIAAYLRNHGARPTVVDPLEDFASACAAGDRAEALAHPELVAALGEQRRAQLVDSAVEGRRHAALRLMAELGFGLDGTGHGTPMHQAAWAGDLETVRLLVELGAEPNIREPAHHATPLGFASHNHQAAVVEFLLPHATIFDALACGGIERVAALLRADPSLANARDEDGPLVFRLRAGMKRLDEVIALLAASGADFGVRNAAGKTILEEAIAGGHAELADALRRVS